MKPLQDIPDIIKETTEVVVKALNRQVKQVVRLVTKQPKKPPLSWESIIGEDGFKKTNQFVVSKTTNLPALPLVNQQLAQLPIEIFEELFEKLQKNKLDEIQLIRLHEKLFESEIQIVRGHVHFYKCTIEEVTETIDYSILIGSLLKLFVEHKKNASLAK
jgi:flavin reductase (DIM6/NTAB) family NADH-FMN oxidoreductase RutF